jgi:gliding motility-associated-like protein
MQINTNLIFIPSQHIHMKNFIASVALLFLFSFVVSAQGTNNSCSNAAPFCTGTQFDFPAGTNTPTSEVGPNYGCLGSEPNPAWYFLQIADSGTVNIDIMGSSNGGASATNDIDFICYGPFTSLLNVCSQLTAANTVDCSYSPSATEQVNIPNGATGEFYMLLLTNYSNTPCNIIFSQGSGTGSTSCGPFNNGPLCTGQDLQLLSFFNDADVTFNWTGPNGFTSSDPNPTIPNITADMAGTYTLVTTNPTDTITGTTVVEIYPSPNASGYTTLGDSCTGGSLVFTPDSVFSNAIYTWTYPDGSTFTGNPYTDNNIDSSLVAGVTLTYEIDGCVSPPVLQTINIYPLPTPIVIGDSHTCHNELSTISCTQNFISYNWNNGVTQPFIESNQGTYSITVVDEYGCVGTSAPFTITNSDPQAQINGITRFCEGDSIQLDASGPYATYLWYPTPAAGAAIDTLTTNDSLYWDGGLLSLVVSDTMGCVDTLNANIPFTPNPVAEYTYLPFEYRILVNTPIQFVDQTTFPVDDSLSTWNWEITSPLLESNEQNPLIAFPDTGIRNIFLTVTSELGCVDTITHQIYIVDKPFVPNAFSPGGDGYNDYLKIPFLNGYPGNSVAIFNRWGKKVYESIDYKNDWNGDELPSGTYFYVVSAPKLEKELKGTIILIRN